MYGVIWKFFPTINCRVSFLDLYLVFPRNFSMIFLPHTNAVILLEPYRGTITEPGLPVLFLLFSQIAHMRIFRSDILKTRFCFNVFAVYLVKMLNQRTNEEMSNYLCASDILIQCRKQIHCIEGLANRSRRSV